MQHIHLLNPADSFVPNSNPAAGLSFVVNNSLPLIVNVNAGIFQFFHPHYKIYQYLPQTIFSDMQVEKLMKISIYILAESLL